MDEKGIREKAFEKKQPGQVYTTLQNKALQILEADWIQNFMKDFATKK